MLDEIRISAHPRSNERKPVLRVLSGSVQDQAKLVTIPLSLSFLQRAPFSISHH